MTDPLLAIAADMAAELRRLPCRIVVDLNGQMKAECPKCSALIRYDAWKSIVQTPKLKETDK